jgi:hypothetical protein
VKTGEGIEPGGQFSSCTSNLQKKRRSSLNPPNGSWGIVEVQHIRLGLNSSIDFHREYSEASEASSRRLDLQAPSTVRTSHLLHYRADANSLRLPKEMIG